MLDANHPIAVLARDDGRYQVDAYAFVFDALHHAHTNLNLGAPQQESGRGGSAGFDPDDPASEEERHITGQELCGAIRHLAQEQFGFMAKCVLNSWGVRETSDFGNIVFNLIEIGQMRKTDADRREDFDDVFDFDRELVDGFEINPHE